MASGDYQLIWVAQGGGGSSSGSVNLNQLTQSGATTGQAIVWNGSSWSAGTISGSGGGTLNALTGDVTTGTPDGSGNAAATVQKVGSYMASDVVSAVASVNTATNTNLAGAIVKRDGSGNFSAGTITASLTGTASSATTAYNYSGTITPSQITQASATPGQALLWNGTAWAAGTVSGGGSGITALTGDVTASGSGSVAATVASVGGSTASAVNTAVTTVSAATNNSTGSTLVKRDPGGGFAASTIIATLSGNATNITGNLALGQLAQGSATSGQALLWNGTAWAPGTVSGGGGTISSLTGDVTASGSGAVAATVASVGGSSASAVNSAVTTVAAATNANTASTIVKRDASGNFSAGTITASLSGNATTATTASSATSYTGAVALSQLSQTSATSGQAIVWNGSAWAPGTVSGGGGGITQLTGDVTTASGSSGSTAATVAFVGGQNAGSVATATVATLNAQTAASANYIVIRDGYGATNLTNSTYSMNGSSITAATTSSGVTYIISSGTNTVTLPANPSGVSLSYRFMGNSGTITVAPPTTGTTPTFYYWGGSTTSSFTCNNQNTANYIECFGIPGTSNYILSNIQGNWQSGGTPLGVFSSFTYPSTSGYVLTANGNTGLASFAAPPASSTQQFVHANDDTQSGAFTANTYRSLTQQQQSYCEFRVMPSAGQVRQLTGVVNCRSGSTYAGTIKIGLLLNPTFSQSATMSGGTVIAQTGNLTLANGAFLPYNVNITSGNTFAAGDKLWPVIIVGSTAPTGSSGFIDYFYSWVVQCATL